MVFFGPSFLMMSQSELYKKAQKFFPAGVNSPVRAFRAVGGTPVFAAKGKGAWVWDESGTRRLDFCNSWGALLFGHAPAGLSKTISREVRKGTSYGMATRKEVELAQRIHGFFSSLEKMRFVSSGTEAVMSAVRLARGFTDRSKILKLEGGYHGHVDSLLVKAGSGAATFGIPDSAGIPEDLAKHTLTIPFNDAAALEEIFRKEGANLAAFILEPVPANMGVVPPRPGYLEKARELTQKNGALLIFDEVITGFRAARGGAQEYFRIRPDLTCLGKILGGGLPFAAFGGRAEVMEKLAPLGPVYQAGTLSGNPLAVSAALWVLDELEKQKSKAFARLKQMSEDFTGELRAFLSRELIPAQINSFASMFTLFFSPSPVFDYASAKHSDTTAFARFFHGCLEKGIYTAPSQFEANFISTAHKAADLKRLLDTFKILLPRILKSKGVRPTRPRVLTAP